MLRTPIFAAAVVLGALAGCGKPAGGSTDGAKVFAEVCAACHGPAGKPDPMMVARIGVKDLTDPALRPRLTAAHVEAQVRGGSTNKLMPAFEGALSAAQIQAVAAFVASPAFVTAAGGGPPPPAP